MEIGLGLAIHESADKNKSFLLMFWVFLFSNKDIWFWYWLFKFWPSLFIPLNLLAKLSGPPILYFLKSSSIRIEVVTFYLIMTSFCD